MGGPKALLPRPDGRAAVAEAISRVREAGCDPVAVVVGAAADEVTRAVGEAAFVVSSPDWETGMGASFRAGLRWATTLSTSVNAVLVTLVDLPDVGADVYARLRAAAVGPETLARATYDGTPGHPVVLGREHWAAATRGAMGDRGARAYLDIAPVTLIECADLATGRDTDRPSDLTFPA
ncbi:MAG: NTP transferase domain-containing protein [Phycicoccus sp.]|nr:NTP transferase domain-containing protein [Phycicoccus sp.]